MRHRFGRKLAVGLALVGAFAMAPGTAWADGTQTPPGAPKITVGVPVFGNTGNPAASPYQDYYRLPNLLAQDVVTIAGLPSGGGLYFCLAGDVDQFNWQQEGCNLARGEYFSSSGRRAQFVAERGSNAAYVRAYQYRRNYQFTVEKIQHRLALRIQAGTEVSRTGRLSVQTYLTNGKGTSAGHRLSLAVVVGGRSYTYRATTNSSGKAVFQLNLPASAEGKSVTLKASSSSSSAKYTGASTSRSIRIVK